ncbi:cyclophilin type peptidyl-prolyl cis-trans isomerase [Achlya hypogyna]|uniref:peptidylprolyl isomerase n=1 Tax=Achlya hypogyna TaxID=1202772 RepID=A0A0A7CNI9_ACHHY|nr:secreted protein [Achlya hypogyna]OQR87717.1 cyclophilin type peptidyl-prolyl cis-trans isomerase [Achlya hypogyna]
MKTVAALCLVASTVAADVYSVLFKTQAGDFTVEVHEDWAPIGAARFKQLIEDKFFDNSAFFRYAPKWVVQWGIAADPKVNPKYGNITDDPINPKVSNLQGTMAYAMDEEANSRTTQVYVNFANNSRLDSKGFTPFAIVTSGYEVLQDKVYAGYGEKPDQDKIYAEGEAYLHREFPLLTHITSATFVRPAC